MAEISVRFTTGKERCLMNLLKKVSAALLCSVLVLTAFPAAISADDDPSEEASAQDVYVSDIPYDDIAFDDDDFDEAEGFGETEIISRTVENGVERTLYTVNWTIPAKTSHVEQRGINFSTDDFFSFNFNFSSSPKNGTFQVGAYNSTNGQYYSETFSGTSFNKLMRIPLNGTYSVKIVNNSSSDVTVTGSYETAFFSGSVYLNVPLCAQEKSLWCWAACTQMCAKYLVNSQKSQTQIVTYVKTNDNDQIGKGSDYAPAMLYATGNQYTVVRVEEAVEVSDIRNQLISKKPVMIALQTSAGGHTNVVTSVDRDDKYLRTNDPAGNGTRKVYKYSALISPDSVRKYYATMKIIANNN